MKALTLYEMRQCSGSGKIAKIVAAVGTIIMALAALL